jgi:hypothetical protein
MKTYLLLPLAAALSYTASAQTAIPIFNPQFKLDTLSCTAGVQCFQQGITGWLVGPQTFLLKGSAAQFTGAPPTGLYVAVIGSAGDTGSILQTLGVTLQANTTYVLKLGIGARADIPFTGYVGALLAGNVTLSASNAATPVGGAFVEDVITYKSGASPSQVGQPLQIFVQSLGTGQVSVAFASLTAVVN